MTDATGRVQYTERFMPRDLEDLAVARVGAVRAAIGPDMRLILDLHGALGPASAIRFLDRVAEFDLLYAEEPVDALSLPAMIRVADRAAMPLAAGERLYSRYHARPFLEAGCLDVLQPDPCLAGGLSEARKIATMAETWGVAIQPHNCGGPVAAAACVQLDLATPNFAMQEWFPYWWDDRIHIATDPLEPKVRASRLAAPEGPGLGVELNGDYLARFPSVRIEA
jgi:galactonate dehydratase